MNNNTLRVTRRIFFLLPTLGSGGGERVISELTQALSADMECVIILFEEKIEYPYKGKILSLGVPLSENYFYRFYAFFLRLSRFKKIIKKQKPDYVISLGTSANIINLLFSPKAVLRLDNYISANMRGFFGKISKILIRFLFKRADIIIAVSKSSRADLAENYSVPAEKVRVIYNPVNIKKIALLSAEPLPIETASIFKSPVVISVGSFLPPKGQWHLIRAFSEAKREVPEAKLVLVGRGEMEPYLRKLTAELKLTNDVFFLGWQENPFKFIAKSTVFVLPSLWEGLPCALLEAMVCGITVISADCKSGPREILAPKTGINKEAENVEYEEFGILTPAFDGKKYGAADPLTKSEKFLAQTMVKILTDKKLALQFSQKAKQRANDFDVKEIIKEWDFLNEQ